MSTEPEPPKIVEPSDDSEPTPGYCERCGEKIRGVCVNGLCGLCADDEHNGR